MPVIDVDASAERQVAQNGHVFKLIRESVDAPVITQFVHSYVPSKWQGWFVREVRKASARKWSAKHWAHRKSEGLYIIPVASEPVA
ncbi:MAG: hypothetical protein GWN58_27560 [Anaerolineae bacterium]|nr:hypothetical protein [Anaerolineae bacterium]